MATPRLLSLLSNVDCAFSGAGRPSSKSRSFSAIACSIRTFASFHQSTSVAGYSIPLATISRMSRNSSLILPKVDAMNSPKDAEELNTLAGMVLGFFLCSLSLRPEISQNAEAKTTNESPAVLVAYRPVESLSPVKSAIASRVNPVPEDISDQSS